MKYKEFWVETHFKKQASLLLYYNTGGWLWRWWYPRSATNDCTILHIAFSVIILASCHDSKKLEFINTNSNFSSAIDLTWYRSESLPVVALGWISLLKLTRTAGTIALKNCISISISKHIQRLFEVQSTQLNYVWLRYGVFFFMPWSNIPDWITNKNIWMVLIDCSLNFRWAEPYLSHSCHSLIVGN